MLVILVAFIAATVLGTLYVRQGLPLVHFSPHPEPFLSLKPPNTPRVSHKERLRQAEKWTGVRPCRAVDGPGGEGERGWARP